MKLPRNRWAFAFFWAIFAIVVVALVEVASNGIASVRDVIHLLAYGLVYAIPAVEPQL